MSDPEYNFCYLGGCYCNLEEAAAEAIACGLHVRCGGELPCRCSNLPAIGDFLDQSSTLEEPPDQPIPLNDLLEVPPSELAVMTSPLDTALVASSNPSAAGALCHEPAVSNIFQQDLAQDLLQDNSFTYQNDRGDELGWQSVHLKEPWSQGLKIDQSPPAMQDSCSVDNNLECGHVSANTPSLSGESGSAVNAGCCQSKNLFSTIPPPSDNMQQSWKASNRDCDCACKCTQEPRKIPDLPFVTRHGMASNGCSCVASSRPASLPERSRSYGVGCGPTASCSCGPSCARVDPEIQRASLAIVKMSTCMGCESDDANVPSCAPPATGGTSSNIGIARDKVCSQLDQLKEQCREINGSSLSAPEQAVGKSVNAARSVVAALNSDDMTACCSHAALASSGAEVQQNLESLRPVQVEVRSEFVGSSAQCCRGLDRSVDLEASTDTERIASTFATPPVGDVKSGCCDGSAAKRKCSCQCGNRAMCNLQSQETSSLLLKALSQTKFPAGTKDRPFACPQCDATFVFKQNRDRHAIEVHLGRRPFECNHDGCGAAFKNSSGLKQHQSTVHLRERPFKCELCGASFGQRNHLTQHTSAVHDRKRPFTCAVCGSSFTNRGNLNQHIRRRNHHQQAASTEQGEISGTERRESSECGASETL